MRRLVIRSLPEGTEPEVPLERRVLAYRRQVEEAITKEVVPLELRGVVKEYFLQIGVVEE